MAVNIDWLDLKPLGWQPSQVSSWGSTSPEFSLPGKIYMPDVPTAGDTIASAIARGLTHVSKNKAVDSGESVPYGKYYNDVPQTWMIWQQPNNNPFSLNEAQSRARGQSADISCHLWVGETQEGQDWIEQNNPMWRWFYDELIDRYEARALVDGLPWYVSHNYGGNYLPEVYTLGLGDLNAKRALYTNPASAFPNCSYSPGGTLSRLNLHCAGVYNMYFDHRDTIFDKIFELEWAKKLVGNVVIFAFPVFESLPGFEHQVYTTDPVGKVGVSNKLPLPAGELLSLGYISAEWGDGLICWGQAFQRTTDSNRINVGLPEWGQGPGKYRWQPAPGSPSSFPYLPLHAGDFFPSGIHAANYDWLHWGYESHTKSMPTYSGERRYASYRIGSGAWREREVDGSDVVWAKRDKVGIASVKKEGNHRKIMYINPYADNISRPIEIRDPWDSNIIYSTSVCTPWIHVANTTI